METLLQKSNNYCAGEIVSNECTMCGDLGFKEKLFKCNSCLFRFQHTYCSSLYPRLDMDSLSCEWCINAARKRRPSSQAEAHHSDFNDNISNQQGIKEFNVGGSIENRGNSELFVGVKQTRKPKLQLQAPRRYRRLADF